MKRKDVEFLSSLQNLAEICNYETRSYSGRGMGGKECLGIEVDVGCAFKFAADIVAETVTWTNVESSAEDSMQENLDSIVEGLRQCKTDDLGKGMILYFPKIKFVKD